ncbi:hypothetical protein PVAP13_8NG120305 [Panicum virgatum]|uniref:Uncharacterized protein n=1 Tax=Panicum virgatum TaxID=38727 RepID=A0A8T0P7A1_PANVG|nr:hypothetical protein PVAP13_8NG120305 [Panicum virgatum]
MSRGALGLIQPTQQLTRGPGGSLTRAYIYAPRTYTTPDEGGPPGGASCHRRRRARCVSACVRLSRLLLDPAPAASILPPPHLTPPPGPSRNNPTRARPHRTATTRQRRRPGDDR